MTIGVFKEPQDETRVSLLPEGVATLIKKGINVLVEEGAGNRAYADDSDYERAGARIGSRQDIVAASDILFAVHYPQNSTSLPEEKILIGI